ncbi:MAG TPA: hypothetical protein VGC89_17040 [Pyrinomonadaceae bacterium]|jgi:hypothetical protein
MATVKTDFARLEGSKKVARSQPIIEAAGRSGWPDSAALIAR